MPCADKEQNSSFEKVTVSKLSTTQHIKDACSPLCICNCCGCRGFANNIIDANIFFSVTPIIDKKTPEYKSILTSNFFGSIWQPPQINA